MREITNLGLKIPTKLKQMIDKRVEEKMTNITQYIIQLVLKDVKEST